MNQDSNTDIHNEDDYKSGVIKCSCGKCNNRLHVSLFIVAEKPSDKGGVATPVFVPMLVPLHIGGISFSSNVITDQEGTITITDSQQNSVTENAEAFFARAQVSRGLFFCEAGIMTWKIPPGMYDKEFSSARLELREQGMNIVQEGFAINTSQRGRFKDFLCRSVVLGKEGDIVGVSSPEFLQEYEEITGRAMMKALGKKLFGEGAPDEVGTILQDILGMLAGVSETESGDEEEPGEESQSASAPDLSAVVKSSSTTLH